MARRHIKSDFAPDVYVFPGGKADDQDAVEGDHFTLTRPPRLATREPPAVGWIAIYMAAIRELFEEAGLLLARGPDGAWPDLSADAASDDRFAEYREHVRSGHLAMQELARRESLVYAGDQLHLFSNWITPEIFNKRFDTYFFLARLPSGQEPRHADLHELTHSLWIRPRAALDEHAGGGFPLVFATERLLMTLAAAESAGELWPESDGLPIATILPRWIVREGEQVFLIPGDAGYESARMR